MSDILNLWHLVVVGQDHRITFCGKTANSLRPVAVRHLHKVSGYEPFGRSATEASKCRGRSYQNWEIASARAPVADPGSVMVSSGSSLTMTSDVSSREDERIGL